MQLKTTPDDFKLIQIWIAFDSITAHAKSVYHSIVISTIKIF